jgi:hypothetical protein
MLAFEEVSETVSNGTISNARMPALTDFAVDWSRAVAQVSA